MTERHTEATKDRYFKDQFIYEPETDGYLCPKGQYLYFQGMSRGIGPIRANIASIML
jgi:hypothetical protein